MIFATCMLNVVISCSNDCSVPRMRRGTCWRRSTDCPCTRTIRPSVSRKCRRRLPPDSSPALWTLLPTTTSWTPARQAGLCSGQVCSVSTRQSFHKVVLKYPKQTQMIIKAFLKVQVLLQLLGTCSTTSASLCLTLKCIHTVQVLIYLFTAWRQSAGDWNVQVYAR